MRVQLDMPDEQVKHLEALMEETGIATKREFFNYAMTLFEWAISETRSGNVVAALDVAKSSYKEIIMPPLAKVGRKAQSGSFRPMPIPEAALR